jgi:hypothetical protein
MSVRAGPASGCLHAASSVNIIARDEYSMPSRHRLLRQRGNGFLEIGTVKGL